MKFLCLFFFHSILFQQTFSQTPHISGTVYISIKKGIISCNLLISNVPALTDYTICLNTGFNMALIGDSAGKTRYRWSKTYGNKSDEAFQYQLTQNDSAVKLLPNSLRFQYTGAFPVISDTSKMYDEGDWKGNIAFNGQTLRMTEQSAWHPLFYDKSKDALINKYTYSINVVCSDATSIYINGDTPKAGIKNIFSSASPVAPMLFAGVYPFKEKDGIYFLNTGLSSKESSLLSKWSNKIIRFYSQQLHIPCGKKIFYLFATPVTKNNVWLFATYPTIAMIGRQMTMHDLFTKTPPLAVDTSNIAFIAHEIAHYYFGTFLIPNSELKWAFLEGFTEYLSLQFVKENLGVDAYMKKIRKYITAVNEAKDITPLNKVNDKGQATEVFKYRYVPLLLVALEKNIGKEKMWKWLQSVLQTQNATTNYVFFRSSLLNAGVDAQTFKSYEEKFINSATALKNISDSVSQ
jgi:hypothetical protein